MVLVEDADGFDIPMPIKECVVIDTDDYNMKRKPVAPAPKQEVVSAKAKGASVKVRQDEEEDERPITYRPAERKGGYLECDACFCTTRSQGHFSNGI